MHAYNYASAAIYSICPHICGPAQPFHYSYSTGTIVVHACVYNMSQGVYMCTYIIINSNLTINLNTVIILICKYGMQYSEIELHLVST